MKPFLFSGIQPSGEIHIGNYLGAIRNWVKLLDEYDPLFCIVDYHALTQPYDRDLLAQRTFDAALVNIAAGLDPERCRLFVQSHVPAHTELAWVFNTVTPMGDLSRMTQFKEKSQRAESESYINAGLFTYPVLQASDILLYKAQAVPVGEDQIQHIELTREIARKFNARYGETFPEPKQIVPKEGARILGLDGKAKMSKSLNNYVGLLEDSKSVWKKLGPAVTDPARVKRTDPGTPEICNIYSLHKSFSPPEDQQHVAEGCRTAGIGCVDCKKILHKNMMGVLEPIQEKAAALRAQPERVEEVLDRGARDCADLAERTMEEVRDRIGLRARR
ncbi:MAG: tryptophan--tRNA ligase [Candidatus Eisenbacteria bacterium]|nr:tryptophan--tRNA ligase [Candidatus Latescibacterota bacterium]MBD3302286.1 tryptophan--tRNA ligase [Candidatus Eisenbacteria bacterium]